MITPARIINFDKTEMNKHKVSDKTETNLNQHFMTLNLRVYQLKCK